VLDGDLLKFGVKRVDAEINPKKDDSRRFLRDQLQYYFQEQSCPFYPFFCVQVDQNSPVPFRKHGSVPNWHICGAKIDPLLALKTNKTFQKTVWSFHISGTTQTSPKQD
jgi:hypothetical protein